MTKPKRTFQQNKALHRGCELIAVTLNEAGLDMRTVLKENVNIPWNKDSVKQHIFKPIMKAMIQKSSTTELDKIGEIEQVWDVIMRHLGERFHIEYIPFPSHQLGYADTAPLKEKRS